MLSYILSARLYSWVENKIKRKSFVIEVPLEQDNIHDYYDLVDSTIQLMEREIKIKDYGK
tara:strand:- start:10096 stop:10275 length:180 start_codon:yes stop_codon:yes gene_type:complete